MKKSIIYLIVIIMMLMTTATATSSIAPSVLTELMRPEAIDVSEGKLYIVEGTTFHVYTLNPLKRIASFGKKGEGPGELKEFIYPNSLTAFPDKLIVEGFNKLIFYDKKSLKYQSEIKKRGFLLKVQPVGKNFVGIRITSTRKGYSGLSLSLMDNQLNTLKELYLQEISDSDTQVDMVTDTIHFSIYKDNIYVEESDKGFVIEVFDSQGNRLREIKKQIPASPVTEKVKTSLMANFKNDKLVNLMAKRSGGWDNFKKNMSFKFPETFPQIKHIKVIDDKIYVSTYQTDGNNLKFVIMDLKGNILSQPFLPLPKQPTFSTLAMGAENLFYAIENDTYYYLRENEDTEEWELHTVKIK